MEIDPAAGLGVGDRRGLVQEQGQSRPLTELELDRPMADDPSGRFEELDREVRHVSWGRAGHGESQVRIEDIRLFKWPSNLPKESVQPPSYF
jgi:hypothetical protein